MNPASGDFPIDRSDLLQTCFWAAGIAILMTSMLLSSGVDAFREEFAKAPWYEGAGVFYFAIILPWYVTLACGVGLATWERRENEVLIPKQGRLLHFLNLVFLSPAILTLTVFLHSVMQWAFGPDRSTSAEVVLWLFLLLVHGWLFRQSWRFVRWTVVGLFRTTDSDALRS